MINPLGAGATNCASFVSPDGGARWEPDILEVDVTDRLSGSQYAFRNVHYWSARIKFSLLLMFFHPHLWHKVQVEAQKMRIQLDWGLSAQAHLLFEVLPEPALPTQSSACHPNLTHYPAFYGNCFLVCIYYLTVGDYASAISVAPEFSRVLGTELALTTLL